LLGSAIVGHEQDGTVPGDASDAECEGELQSQGRECDERGWPAYCSCQDGAGWWFAESDVGRVADGIPRRVDRLRTLGNGWVPQVAAVIAGRIAELTARRVTA
jgi:DNA (cytosine-5)-methyltransferase 1